MEKEILEEICKDMNWNEKILVKLYKRSFIKVYHKIRIKLFNANVR